MLLAACSCARTATMPQSDAAPKPLPLSFINERDIDLILLTAIHWSAAFRAALVKKVSGAAIAEFIGARREVHTRENETDLVLEVRTESGERLSIIVHAKTDPSFQLRQSERCRSRGHAGKALGHWDRFLTCLCAPKSYASLYVRAGDWDHVLCLEDAAEELAIPSEPFAAFLCAAMRQTADEYEREGRVASLKATAFWARYADLCLQEFPNLRMARPRAVTLSNDLRPRFFVNTPPTGVRLEHKASNGHVDLSLQKRDARDLAEKLGDALPHDLSILSARRSAVIRAIVPRLVATDPFEPQTEAVRAGLIAVGRLIELWPDVRGRMGYDPRPAPSREPLRQLQGLATNWERPRRLLPG
jgi:hypothetical protein